MAEINSNHPFMDGNKRTAYVLMRLILLDNQLSIRAKQEEIYDFVMGVAKGEIRFDGIKNWISSKLVQDKER